VLNGNKLFISGIGDGHQVLVVVRTSSGGDGKRPGLTLFIVDTDSAGLIWDTMVSHAEHQYFVYFDEFKVPKGNILGKIDDGYIYFLMR